MTLTEHTHPHEYPGIVKAKDAEIAELKDRITTLEAELEEAKAVSKVKREPRKLSAYKVHEYVTVILPGYVDDEDGRVIEMVPGKSAITVGTAKGTFSIGDPARIKRQSEEW